MSFLLHTFLSIPHKNYFLVRDPSSNVKRTQWSRLYPGHGIFSQRCSSCQDSKYYRYVAVLQLGPTGNHFFRGGRETSSNVKRTQWSRLYPDHGIFSQRCSSCQDSSKYHSPSTGTNGQPFFSGWERPILLFCRYLISLPILICRFTEHERFEGHRAK